MEFLAPFSDDEKINLTSQITQLALDPMTAIFENPSDDKRQHLKALFVKGRVDGQLISKILIMGELQLTSCRMRCIGSLAKEIRLNQDRYDVEGFRRKCVSTLQSRELYALN